MPGDPRRPESTSWTSTASSTSTPYSLWPSSAAPAGNLLDAGPCAAAESLIACHVYSFSCFPFSSLVASALKQAIRIIGGGDGEHGVAHAPALRVGMVSSAFGSVLGSGFLVAAPLNLVQIKLGIFGCRRWEMVAAAVPLASLVPLALFIYAAFVLHALTR